MGECEKYCKWLFNWGVIVFFWVIFVLVFVNVVLFGVIIVVLWRKYNMCIWDIYGYVVVVGELFLVFGFIICD